MYFIDKEIYQGFIILVSLLDIRVDLALEAGHLIYKGNMIKI